jgi:hypothetical protein
MGIRDRPIAPRSPWQNAKMIKQATKRGYVTHEQLNAVIPSEAVLNQVSVLIVEDEPFIALDLAVAVKEDSYRVVWWRNDAIFAREARCGTHSPSHGVCVAARDNLQNVMVRAR